MMMTLRLVAVRVGCSCLHFSMVPSRYSFDEQHPPDSSIHERYVTGDGSQMSAIVAWSQRAVEKELL